MQDNPGAMSAEPAPASPLRASTWKRRGWAVPLIAVIIVAAVVLAAYYAFIVVPPPVPRLPIPAGTVLHLEDNQTVEWHFTVTRCCANLTGAYRADHAVDWGYALWAPGLSDGPVCVSQEPSGPVQRNMTYLGFGTHLPPADYLLDVVYCSGPSATVTMTQTVGLSYE